MAMPCATAAEDSACLDRILSLRTGAELAPCRACWRGRELMETVRDYLPAQWFAGLPDIKKRRVNMETLTAIRNKVARKAGVATGSMDYIL
jgi:hypothetical protein